MATLDCWAFSVTFWQFSSLMGWESWVGLLETSGDGDTLLINDLDNGDLATCSCWSEVLIVVADWLLELVDAFVLNLFSFEEDIGLASLETEIYCKEYTELFWGLVVFEDSLGAEPAADSIGDAQLSPEVFLEINPFVLLNTTAAFFV